MKLRYLAETGQGPRLCVPMLRVLDDLEAAERTIDAQRAQIEAAPDLLALLEELIDIEGPQPGHVMWARKVQAAIAKVKGGA